MIPSPPDLRPPWCIFAAEGKSVAVLPIGRPGQIADVRFVPDAIVEEAVKESNLLPKFAVIGIIELRALNELHRPKSSENTKESSGTMFYFGCQREPGHYLWRGNGSKANVYTDTPWGRTIDGGIIRGRSQPQGEAKLAHQYGWTAIDFWDRSVDRRFGSHSAFVKSGSHSFEDMLAWAKAEFPWVFERFTTSCYLGQP